MRLVRLAMCVAAFAVVGKIAFSEDIDVQSLQAKLAAQEARLNDLQAKMNSGAYAAGGEVEGLLSANKNAVVTIGGTVNTRYYYYSGKESGGDVQLVGPGTVDATNSAYFATGTDRWVGMLPAGTIAPGYGEMNTPGASPGFGMANFGDIRGGLRDANGDLIGYYLRGPGAGYPTQGNWDLIGNGYARRKYSEGDLKMADAKLTVKIDVNEYFDAFLKIDLQSSNDGSGSDNAEQYWVRWKNVCNTGFGLKVGRDVLIFGDGTPIGVLGTYAAGGGDGIANAIWDGGLGIPIHNNWDEGRFMQVMPYWESRDGKFAAELALYQNHGWHQGRRDGDWYDWTNEVGTVYRDGNKWKSRNYGFGSASFRLTWKPIEGLKLTASVANFHDKGEDINLVSAKNNTATSLAFQYRPCFFNRMNIWGQWIHGWNVDNIKDVDSDAINLGVSFDLNESWTIFAMGDYLQTKGFGKYNTGIVRGGTTDLANVGLSSAFGYDKAVAWSGYMGVKYTLPYGVSLEAGWKHEQVKWKKNVLNKSTNVRVKDAKIKGDTLYAHLGFDF